MEFAEKLNFLFEVTQAKGKELAAAMNLTPPQISKMRKGLRGLPRNREAAHSIALFFAQRCASDEQRGALAKGMRMAQVRGADDEELLADMLLSWLLNEKIQNGATEKSTDLFLHRLNFSSGAGSHIRSDSAQPSHSAGDSVVAYYGIEGKRAAYMLFLRTILEKEEAFDVCILSDENKTWIDEDPSFASTYYDHLMRLAERGCFYKRIVGPISNVDQAFYSLNRWFPLYLTGKSTSFYYKRIRDELNRITVFVVEGVAAMFSFSVGAVPDQDCVTFFTTDAKMVKSMFRLFRKYLAMCDPAMKIYNADTTEVKMYGRLLEYESCAATCMQLSPSLSFITLPWEVAVSLRTGREITSKDAFLASFAKRYNAFKKNLEQHDFFDFIHLADADDVMDGMAAIPAANILGDETQYYSPEGYLQHLKNVEYLLKRHRHYHVIIEPTDAKGEPIIYVKEDCAVLLARVKSPFVMFDVSEHNLIAAFTENMRRRIPNEAFEAEFRKKALNAVGSRIEELEGRIGAARTSDSAKNLPHPRPHTPEESPTAADGQQKENGDI